MNDFKLRTYELALKSKAAELSIALRDRSQIAIEQAAESVDLMVMAANREIGILTLDRDTRIAREVQDALRRIHDGSYGICLRCEEPIKPRRLEAVPWARYCVHCQEILEQERSEEGGSVDFAELAAA
ncbi:MAG: TraR/DksA family transcriptional regulator [Bryobacterales bacterium]|nr:TraR/DksA family transcriptional regulator [Bryobacterales bacterium]